MMRIPHIKYHIFKILLMAAMLLPFSAIAAEDAITEAVVDTSATAQDVDTAMVARLSHQMPALSNYEPHHGMDFTFFKNRTNPNVKPYTFIQDQTWAGVPLFLAGLIAKSEKYAFRQDYRLNNSRIRLIKYNFHSEIDNYTQFSGIALTVGLKLAGIEGRSSWPRLAASSLASYAVMAGLVNSIKYTASEMRPDSSTFNSWPSGHTATAFVGATILHKEYGLTRSPWYSIAGYTFATATGVMRVLNNRHWISDVLSGAGIGILSTELAYGICDLLFKERGLLRNDISSYPDLSKNPSFFSVSMGIGLGNRNLTMPSFEFTPPPDLDNFDEEELTDTPDDEGDFEPMTLQFRSATAVGVEGAWFFCPNVGIGGRLRVKSTPIKGWKAISDSGNEAMSFIIDDPLVDNAIHYIDLTVASDHITEFAADAGIYFNLPITSRFAIGSKLLLGHSVMDDIEVTGTMRGTQLDFNFGSLIDDNEPMFTRTDIPVSYEWNYINVHASNSMKFGTGISLTYAYKNSFSWRVFCDYDYSTKTYTATYNPFEFFKELSPDMVDLMDIIDYDFTQSMVSSARKHLHQWVLGGALCVSF